MLLILSESTDLRKVELLFHNMGYGRKSGSRPSRAVARARGRERAAARSRRARRGQRAAEEHHLTAPRRARAAGPPPARRGSLAGAARTGAPPLRAADRARRHAD